MSVITISRQVGSLGDQVAQEVARRLEYQVVDRDRLRELAGQCDSEFKSACELYQRETFHNFFERYFGNNAANRALFESVHFELASRGNVILMGRGGQMALRDVQGTFHVRVVAPDEVRVERIMEDKGFERDRAWQYLRQYDHDRRVLIESIYRMNLNDWYLYDMILNTAHYEVEAAAEVLVTGFERKQKGGQPAEMLERLKNEALAKRMESAILKHIYAYPFTQIQVKVSSDAVVTLEGFVQDEREKRLAEEVVNEHFPGLLRVENHLRVLGPLHG
jgi:cytidylate kinase